MSIFPPKEVVDAVLDACFFSRPVDAIYPSIPREYKHVDIQIGTTVFRGHTIDPDFTAKSRNFMGKIRIMHNSSWATRMDMHRLNLVKLIITLPSHSRHEFLSVYVDKGVVNILKEKC